MGVREDLWGDRKSRFRVVGEIGSPDLLLIAKSGLQMSFRRLPEGENLLQMRNQRSRRDPSGSQKELQKAPNVAQKAPRGYFTPIC